MIPATILAAYVRPVPIRSAATAPAPTLAAQWHALATRKALVRWVERHPHGSVRSWAVWERVVPMVVRRRA